MRIRKRQVPLPFSSLSPVPVSDPPFNRSPVVQLHCKHDPHQNLTEQSLTTLTFLPQPSDHPNQPIGANDSRFDSPPDDDVPAAARLAQTQNNKDGLALLRDEDYGRREEEEGEKGSNDTRKKNIFSAEASRGVELSQFSSSHQVVGRWCEGEKSFPLKKRRGSFERRAANNDETEGAVLEKDKKMKTKMKTKMNKKFSALEEENNMNEVAEAEDNKETTKDISFDSNTTTTTTPSSAKKRGRGGALMEGSRCSRVNGRGWRCCQQTLVGYSLCEHHLGKGRLRSMTSVRSRALGSTTSPTPAQTKKNETEYHHHHRPLSNATSLPSTQQESHKTKLEYEAEDGDGIGDEDDQKPLVTTTKRRVKLGTVKARSISSLLGQTTNNNNNNNEVSSVADNNKQHC